MAIRPGSQAPPNWTKRFFRTDSMVFVPVPYGDIACLEDTYHRLEHVYRDRLKLTTREIPKTNHIDPWWRNVRDIAGLYLDRRQ
jgi:hypothetical protein